LPATKTGGFLWGGVKVFEKNITFVPIIHLAMDTKVDMTYRFIWDEDPTDEQLETLMREVGEDIRQETTTIAKIWEDNMRREINRANAKHFNMQEKEHGKA
jgi:hypothetical protein